MPRQDDGLRKLLGRHIPRLHWVMIESGMTAPGTPDANYCADGTEGWVECKRTRGWDVPMRPLQVGWHLRRARSGGVSFVAVRRRHSGGPRRGESADELWLLRGADVRLYDGAGGLRRSDGAPWLLGLWRGGPSRWDWPAVEACLLNPSKNRPVKP